VTNGMFTVFIVDDDAGVLKALSRLLRAKGCDTRSFMSPQEFLAASFVWRCLSGATMTPFPHPSHRTGHEDFPHPALGQDFTPSPTARRVPGCAVLDVSMPDFNGLQLQQALTAGGTQRPVIFITGKGDIPTSVRAMKAGAIDFLTKPVSERDLLDAIDRAKQQDAKNRQIQAELTLIQAKIATLTPREREVLAHVVAGRLNKQIAGDLGTVEKTIKVHRSRMMEKLGVRTVADLVRLAEKAGISVQVNT
jgi:FixJ family two-component response regulator